MDVSCSILVLHLVIASMSEVDGDITAVMNPPKFVKPINAQEVQKGASAHFVVEVSGTPTPQVSWFREGHQILHSEDFQIIQVRAQH